MNYLAQYGSTTVQGSLIEIGDVLASRGFDMTQAEHLGPHAMQVPHTLAHRQPAKVHKLPEEKSPEIVALERTYQETMHNGGVGLQTRHCGAVHPEGLVCIVPVLYQPKCPHCDTDQIYGHDGPHEALVDGVVRFRWVETLQIEDLSYNAYGPMEEDDES